MAFEGFARARVATSDPGVEINSPSTVWPRFATNIERFVALPRGHYPNEQSPEETLRELNGLFEA